ncbi:hypothetical protein [Pseudomonas promysalinigenes]|uniref:BAHD family acyl transferase n=1 Tax=Pseudomonas putida TaxID=303 RepID=G8AA90_PSEPU|nr:hypothetical protein [Pseudomonas promysalinigenes]ADQ74620.1 BAHD family acyl transferase [Pseudomonas putida]QXI32359.1 hypothetical protein HU725_015150 [Pseudomonas promysalinigenes]
MSLELINVRGKRCLPSWPLSGIDKMVESWADYLLVYDYPLDVQAFATHLASALDVNPYFAGRKQTTPQGLVATGDNQGVRLEISRHTLRLPLTVLQGDYRGLDPFCDRTWRERHRLSRTSLSQPLLQIRLSLFEDATVVGFSVWHGLSDGTTFFEFLACIAQFATARSEQIDAPDFTPLDAVAGPMPGHALVDRWQRPAHEQVLARFAEAAFTLTKENIERLLGGCDYHGFMRDDLLISCIWRLIITTDIMPDQQDVVLYPVYDARLLMGVSAGRMGNLLCYPTVKVRAMLLREMSLPAIAGLVRQAVGERVMDCETLHAELQAICAVADGAEKGRYLLSPLYESFFGNGVLFNNLTGMPCQRFDLGAGGPVHVDSPLHDPMRFVQFFPCLSGAGLMTVKVNLELEHLQRFKAAFLKELHV